MMKPKPKHACSCRAGVELANGYLSSVEARPTCRLPPHMFPNLQMCHLDCREASDLNDTQRGWVHPPYDVSSSLSRLSLGFKVRRGGALGSAGWSRVTFCSGLWPAMPMPCCHACSMQTLSMLATHYDGSVQYNTHQL